MNPLKEFQNDAPKRDALKAYMFNLVKDLAGEAAMAGQPVVGYPEALKIITKVFAELDKLK